MNEKFKPPVPSSHLSLPLAPPSHRNSLKNNEIIIIDSNSKRSDIIIPPVHLAPPPVPSIPLAPLPVSSAPLISLQLSQPTQPALPAQLPSVKSRNETQSIESDATYSKLQAMMRSETHSRLMAEKKVAALESSHAKSLRLAEERQKMLEFRLNEEIIDKQRMKLQYETDISDEVIRYAEEALWREYQHARLEIAAVLIQKHLRGLLNRQFLKKQIQFVTLIQSLFRAWIVRKKVSIFLSAVRSLQKCFLNRKCQRQRSILESVSVGIIQSSFRRHQLSRHWRLFTKKMRALKSFIASCATKQTFRRQQDSIVKVQSWVRRYLVVRNFRLMSTSASKIQRLFRWFRLRKEVVWNKSASKIQTKWKEFIFRRSVNSSVLQAKRFESFVQRRAAFMILRCFRMYTKKKQELHSATVITRWYLSVLPILRIRKLRRGIVRLQALRRSLAVRRSMPRDVANMHTRIKRADQNSIQNPQLRLGNQTNEAISILLKGKMISHILRACQTLELATLYSSVCCLRFVQSAASKILFTLICSCNRSTPHQELLR